MGYLDNSSVTIDAILTIKGRELLARGGDNFKITQFALGDDEIDYTLWNTNHPLGTAYYGTIIENMPILEAVPDETQALRSKLVTLPKATKKIPVVTVTGGTTFTMNHNDMHPIAPSSTNGANATSGYTAIVADNTVLKLTVSKPVPNQSAVPTTSANASAHSISAVGFAFNIQAIGDTTKSRSTTVTIIANETGGSVTLNVTVNKWIL